MAFGDPQSNGALPGPFEKPASTFEVLEAGRALREAQRARDEVNPKTVAAQEKPPLDLLEHLADIEISRALQHGARKYGRRNFYRSPIPATVYAGAIRRHIGAWNDGEDLDPDSGLSHLAHVGACIHVLFAAMRAETFIDDRLVNEAPPTTESDA